jgi:RNA polymerase sigma factor (sigma-70 family)
VAADGREDKRRWVLSVLDEYEGPLVRYALRLLGDEEAARDVVQHVFLRLCDQSSEGLRDRVGPWLFSVCRNKAVDLLRVRQRTSSLDGDCEEPVGREADPADAAERGELYRRLGDLVAELPPARREALDLWSAGFNCRQIAQIAGYSEANVRVLIHRALKQLRSQLAPSPSGRG